MSDFIRRSKNTLNKNLELIDEQYREVYIKALKIDNDYFKKQLFLDPIFYALILAKKQGYSLEKIIDSCLFILDSKANDYSEVENRYSSFEFTGELFLNVFLKVNFLQFNIIVQSVFFLNIAQKVSRLKNLILNKKTPKNESIEDSIIDLINYSLLLEGYKKGLK